MADLNSSCVQFVEELHSKAPVPGGGGASALVGAIGTALGGMVGNLTTGKKKYAEYEEDIQRIIAEAVALEKSLLEQIEGDARVFEPLSKAYSIPKDDPSRGEVMEAALREACTVPMDIMRDCCKAIDLHTELAQKGSALAISDVGVGVLCLKSALMGASLNVFINTKSMVDREYATKLETEADGMLEKYCAIADETYASVIKRLR